MGSQAHPRVAVPCRPDAELRAIIRLMARYPEHEQSTTPSPPSIYPGDSQLLRRGDVLPSSEVTSFRAPYRIAWSEVVAKTPPPRRIPPTGAAWLFAVLVHPFAGAVEHRRGALGLTGACRQTRWPINSTARPPLVHER